MGVPENEKLQLNIAATIQFSFGSICDKVQSILENTGTTASEIVGMILSETPCTQEVMVKRVRKILDEKALNNIRILQREARNQGNSSIRIIENHMQHFKILRRYKRDKINVERVAKEFGKREESGSP